MGRIKKRKWCISSLLQILILRLPDLLEPLGPWILMCCQCWTLHPGYTEWLITTEKKWSCIVARTLCCCMVGPTSRLVLLPIFWRGANCSRSSVLAVSLSRVSPDRGCSSGSMQTSLEIGLMKNHPWGMTAHARLRNLNHKHNLMVSKRVSNHISQCNCIQECCPWILLLYG